MIVGPSTFNFAEAAEQAIGEGAAVRVPDAPAAVTEALQLIADEPAAAT